MQINTDISTGSNLPLIRPQLQADESAPKTPDAQITPVEQDEHKGPNEPKKSAHGVLRLLEAGHFNGVADARLRIIFQDQLADEAELSAKEELRTRSRDLVDIVNDAAGNTLTTVKGDDLHEEPVEHLQLQFSESINSAVSDAISSESLDLDSIDSAFTAAFEELTLGLEELLGSSDEEVVPSENVNLLSETDSTLKQALEDLSDIFAQALSDLLGAVETNSLLPDPAPAPGNGAAYEKFLAQYDQLRYGESQLDISA